MEYILGLFNEQNGPGRQALDVFVERFPDGFLVERGHTEDTKGGFLPSKTEGALPVVTRDFVLEKSPFRKPDLISRVFYLDKVQNEDGKNLNLFWKGVSIGRGDTHDINLPDLRISKFQAYYVAQAGPEKQPALVDCGSESTLVHVFTPYQDGQVLKYRQVTMSKNKPVKMDDKCIVLFGGREGFAFQFYKSASFYEFLKRFGSALIQ